MYITFLRPLYYPAIYIGLMTVIGLVTATPLSIVAESLETKVGRRPAQLAVLGLSLASGFSAAYLAALILRNY